MADEPCRAIVRQLVRMRHWLNISLAALEQSHPDYVSASAAIDAMVADTYGVTEMLETLDRLARGVPEDSTCPPAGHSADSRRRARRAGR